MLTRLAEQGMGDTMAAHVVEAPLGKGAPQDVANGAVFLLADASRWITRATLYIDGGLTCQISAQ
jgi:NAD(P)-dependent dehydrogenase (short-subunit alcohol dehydrogenase family)